MGLFEKISINVSDARILGSRFLRRHVAKRTGAIYPVAIEGFGSLYVRAASGSDLNVVRQVFKDQQYLLGGIYADRVVERYEEILSQGKTPLILDAGANIGASARWFKVLFPKSRVIAVEPDPENCAVLKANGAGIDVVEAAVGSSSGFAALKNGSQGWATQIERSAEGIEIVRIDDLFARFPDGVPFVAKIDIEGFERDLFDDGLDWLDTVFAVYIEPHDWMMPGKRTSSGFQRAFGQSGEFELLIQHENLIYVRCPA